MRGGLQARLFATPLQRHLGHRRSLLAPLPLCLCFAAVLARLVRLHQHGHDHCDLQCHHDAKQPLPMYSMLATLPCKRTWHATEHRARHSRRWSSGQSSMQLPWLAYKCVTVLSHNPPGRLHPVITLSVHVCGPVFAHSQEQSKQARPAIHTATADPSLPTH